MLGAIGRRRAEICTLALRVGRTGADGRDAIRLRPFDLVFPGWRRIEMQAHEQIRAAPVGQRRTVGQINIGILAARQDDIEPGFFELVAQFQRQRQCVGLLAVPERVVARVLAAVPRVKADGRDAFGVGEPGRE